MEIILYQPQIPQNTGNIARTCAVTGTRLTLVEPLGFSISDRWLKRSGLDYWEDLDLKCIDDIENYLENITEKNVTFFSSKAEKLYTEMVYHENSILVFGSETSGLPPHLYDKWSSRFATIPMLSGARCLNLATSAGIALYEGWRQVGFKAPQ